MNNSEIPRLEKVDTETQRLNDTTRQKESEIHSLNRVENGYKESTKNNKLSDKQQNITRNAHNISTLTPAPKNRSTFSTNEDSNLRSFVNQRNTPSKRERRAMFPE